MCGSLCKHNGQQRNTLQRQEGNLLQHDLARMVQTSGVLHKAVYLSTAHFGESFLAIINSIPCVQQNLRRVYTETLYKVHMASSRKMSTADSNNS